MVWILSCLRPHSLMMGLIGLTGAPMPKLGLMILKWCRKDWFGHLSPYVGSFRSENGPRRGSQWNLVRVPVARHFLFVFVLFLSMNVGLSLSLSLYKKWCQSVEFLAFGVGTLHSRHSLTKYLFRVWGGPWAEIATEHWTGDKACPDATQEGPDIRQKGFHLRKDQYNRHHAVQNTTQVDYCKHMRPEAQF